MSADCRKITGTHTTINMRFFSKDLSYSIYLMNKYKVEKGSLKNQWSISLTENGKPINFPPGQYRLSISIYDDTAQQAYIGRGVVEFVALKNDQYAPVKQTIEKMTNDPNPEPVPSASVYVISEKPLEIDILFASSPDALFGDIDVERYEVWRGEPTVAQPVKLGEVPWDSAQYVDSTTNNPENPPRPKMNYYYLIRTYDKDGNYSDSVKFWLNN